MTAPLVPAAMRIPPPPAALRWVERAVGPGARVVRVRRLRNAWAAAMHAVDVEHGGVAHALVLRRWARTDIDPDEGVVDNEAAALDAVLDAQVRAPRLVAADPEGEACGAPALLMTRLRGRDVLSPPDVARWSEALAATLRSVHEIALPRRGLGAYEPWNLDVVTAPPTCVRAKDAWARAIEIAHGEAPTGAPVLCHRDFHPGNVLWHRGRVSGVVDWTHACRGPAAVDVAHCRLNLCWLFGLDVADAFADLAYYDCVDAVGVGDHPPDAWRWNDAGRSDLTTDGLIARLDDFVTDAVGRAG